MPELGPYGSVRGARGNSRPYRERQPYQRHAVRGDALRDRAVEQFELLLVQSQSDDRLGHGGFLVSAISGPNPVYRI